MSSLDATHYLLSLQLLRDKVPSFDRYPFCLETVRQLDRIDFHPKVTYIIGENGSGKSTLLEALATAYGFNPEGGTRNFNFATRATHSSLHQYLRLAKSYRQPKDGFFLRAETFYNVASTIDDLLVAHAYGGKSLHQQSHGESFFSLITHRFGGKGLYILDEPEAALSAARQMAMLARIHDLVQDNSQFIIATHSPILLAYPDADIYQIQDGLLTPTAYEDSEPYTSTRHFLNNHQAYIKRLLS
ncbi:MAG TPA: AAA family ATPase [Pseudomonas sp.]|nr:AAA family ATPase [Pseudomonas sp.]